MGKKRCETVYQPTAGVYTDFENILQRFSQTDTVRYEKFAEIWREMNMSYLFAGRQNEREAREFVEECYRIALKFWLPPYNFQVRVGGLYLLYGLFSTQPLLQKARIRVTPSDWQSILVFHNEAHQQQHWDVDFVFQKLRLASAFDFVATELEKYPSLKDIAAEDATIPDEFKEETSVLFDLFSADVLEQFSTLHQHYHKVKVGLEGPDSDRPARSLDVINADLISGVTNAISHYQERRKSHSQHTRRMLVKSESDEDTYKSAAEDDVDEDPSYKPWRDSSKKFRIKAKAFKQIAKAQRSRRHRQATKEPSSHKRRSRKSKFSNMDDTSDQTTDLNTSTATDEDGDGLDDQPAVMSMPSFLEEGNENSTKQKGKKRAKKHTEDKSTPPKKRRKQENQTNTGSPSKNVIKTEQFEALQNEISLTSLEKDKKSNKSPKKAKKNKKKSENAETEIINDAYGKQDGEIDTVSPSSKKINQQKSTKGTKKQKKRKNSEIEIVNDELEKPEELQTASLSPKKIRSKSDQSPKSTKKQKKKKNNVENEIVNDELDRPGEELQNSFSSPKKKVLKSDQSPKSTKKQKKKKEEIEIEIVNDELEDDSMTSVSLSPKKQMEISESGKKNLQKKSSGKEMSPKKSKEVKKKVGASLQVKLPPPKKRKS